MVNLKQYYVHKKSTYKYELTADEYNPTIDDEVEISVRVTDYADDPVSNMSVELFKDGTSVSASITNNQGIASWTITMNDWDKHHFNVSNQSLQLQAHGYKKINGAAYYGLIYSLYVDESTRMARITLNGTNVPVDAGNTNLEVSSFVRPKYLPQANIIRTLSRTNSFNFYLWASGGTVGISNNTGASTTLTVDVQIDYTY